MTDIPCSIEVSIVSKAAHMTTEHRQFPESIPAFARGTGERSVGGEAEPNRDTYQTGKQRDTLGKVPCAPLFPTRQAFRVLNSYASASSQSYENQLSPPAFCLGCLLDPEGVGFIVQLDQIPF